MSAIIPETQSIKAAVIHINSIDNSKFSRLLSRILQKLHLKEERSFSEEEEEKLQAALSLDRQTLQLLLDGVSFILEQAVYHSVKPAALRQQLENLRVEPEKAEVFAQAWASHAPDLLEKIRHRIFTPRKLERVSWELSLQMGRSDQSRLKAPHATVSLGLQTGGDTEDVLLGFSHRSLLEFYHQMEQIQTQLDSLT